jgi:hypothetical protein
MTEPSLLTQFNAMPDGEDKERVRIAIRKALISAIEETGCSVCGKSIMECICADGYI